MQVKGILFGFGLGMVLLSVIILLAYRSDVRRLVAYEEDAIVRQAAELGMVWPTDDVAEVVRRALDMGMLFENEEDMPDLDHDGLNDLDDNDLDDLDDNDLNDNDLNDNDLNDNDLDDDD